MTDHRSEARLLYQQAKDAADDQQLCLSYLQRAYALDPKRKYEEKISKLRQMMQRADESDESGSSDDVILLSAERNKKKYTGGRGNGDASGARCSSVDSLSRAVDRVTVTDYSEAQVSTSTNRVNEEAGSPGPVVSAGREKKRKRPEIGGHRIKEPVHQRLYQYQIEGLRFMLRLFDANAKGCILADDMGLGKTIQTIVLLSTLMDENKIKSVLIVAPNTLLVNWGKEFQKWYPSIDIYSYHSGAPNKRLEQLRTVQRHGGVIFTTFGLLQNHVQYMNTFRDRDFVWDFVVLDEAHKIKSPTKTTRAVSDLHSRFNLAITGTPVQNNLKELWTIYNWVMDGELLGGYTQFKMRYEMPITNARKKDATEWIKKNGTLLAEDLRKIYAPYFLRRTKDEVMGRRTSLSGDSVLQPLPPKFDWIVWITLSEDQIQLYKQYLKSRGVKEAKIDKKNALTKLVDLKKICDSPFLLSRNMIAEMEKLNRRRNDLDSSHLDALLDDDDEGLVSIDSLSVKALMSNTAKLVFLIELLENHRSNGHRTLVFSQSTRMLDIIQKVLTERNFKLARLDGRVKMKDRDAIVTTFQESETIDVCLLSTGVGAVGLTLTNADRVVIYDPSWNPGSDAQAIDRAYRIGQTKPVLVYRLITCATVEEKIFIRQVFKNSVIKQMVQSERDPTRYFGQSDIRELLTFDDPKDCKTFRQIEEMHSHQKVSCPDTDEHLCEVRRLPNCFNVSDHDILFSVATEEIVLDDEEEVKILTNVKQTRQNLDSETDGIRRNQEGKYRRPFEMRVGTSSSHVYEMKLDALPNPTQIPDDLEIVELEPVSHVFTGQTIAIDESDLQIIPPNRSPQRSFRSRSADLLNDDASDSDATLPDDDCQINTSSLSLQEAAKKSSGEESLSDRWTDETVPIPPAASPARHMSESDHDDSEVVTRKTKRRLTELLSDSDPDMDDVCDAGSDEDKSNAHGTTERERDVALADDLSADPLLLDFESDAGSVISEVGDLCGSPFDFKSPGAKFHSTAFNLDVDSPVAGGTPSHVQPDTQSGGSSASSAADAILADDSDASDDSSPSFPFRTPAHDPRSPFHQTDCNLSDIFVQSFDKTNYALKAEVRDPLGLILDSRPGSADETLSPTIDDSRHNFYPIRESLIRTPTPSRSHLSISKSVYFSGTSTSHLQQTADPFAQDADLFDDRADSPLVDDVAEGLRKTLLLSTSPNVGGNESPPLVSPFQANVTLRKSRAKSRSGTNVSGRALNFSDDEDAFPIERDSPTF